MPRKPLSLPRLPRLGPFHFWIAGLGIVMLVGLAAGLVVFSRGLIVTNLSDKVPWGLWITMDLSSIAVAAGAFSLSAGLYLLGLKQLRPVARVAVFVGLIGYTMAMLCLLLDIGRPERFWHGFVFWNTHSVLWEVTMCVGLYLCVLVVEFLPMVGEAQWMRARFGRVAGWLRKLHHLAPALAIVGLCLSLLHQSSLGATYGVVKARPLWFKPDLSILFIVSAVMGGQALTVLAALVAGKFRRDLALDRSLLDKVAQFVGFVVVGYLYFKFWDVLATTYTYAPGRTEGLWLLTDGALQWTFWLGEIVLGLLVPAVILFSPRRRADDRLLMTALALIVLGVVLNRWDVNMSGQLLQLSYLPSQTAPALVAQGYFPSPIEWATAAGILAYGLAFFSLGARYLPVFSGGQEHAEQPAPAQPAPEPEPAHEPEPSAA